MLYSAVFFCLQVPLCLKLDGLAATQSRSLLSVQPPPVLPSTAMEVVPEPGASRSSPITGKCDPKVAVWRHVERFACPCWDLYRMSNIYLRRDVQNVFAASGHTCNDNPIFISHCVFYCRVGCYWLWLQFRRYCFHMVCGVAWLCFKCVCSCTDTCMGIIIVKHNSCHVLLLFDFKLYGG